LAPLAKRQIQRKKKKDQGGPQERMEKADISNGGMKGEGQGSKDSTGKITKLT